METSIPLTPKNAIHSLAVLITAEMRRYGIVSKEEDVEKAIAEIGLEFTFQIVDDAGKKREYVAGYAMGRPFIRQKFNMDAVTRRHWEDILERLKVQAEA